MKRLLVISLAILSGPFIALVQDMPASAANLANFKAGRIIDDVVFTKKDSMTVSQIQDFLNSKVPSCDTSGSQPSEFGGGTRAQYGASRGNPAPFTCLKDYIQNPTTGLDNYGGTPTPEGGLSAAQIIWNYSQQFSINPQVILVTLQKENGMVTDEWPFLKQYREAMGFGCPDNTAPGAPACDPSFGSFSAQIYQAARHFRNYMDRQYCDANWCTPYRVGQKYIAYDVEQSCGGSVVNIENLATSALYSYTPYQPSSAALAAGYGSAEPCGAYGNRNFFNYFTDWFGTTYGYIYNGISYTDVFDATHYLNSYPDLQAAYGDNTLYAFNHFITYGMKEGRQAKADFNVSTYRNRYQDLRLKYGTDLSSYYVHFITNGKAEGRYAVGDAAIQYITSLNGIDYSTVYNYTTYLANNADMQQKYNNDDAGAIRHFINYGMGEARNASTEFNVNSYRSLYYDLRRVLGSNIKAYYHHYVTNGKAEGRTGTSSVLGGTSTLNGVNYSSVYVFNTYETSYADIKNAFGLDDIAALSHFVNYGMGEGRQASPEFNVYIYKNRYPDLQSKFGNNLKQYHIHYMNYGKAEGRTGN